MKAEFDWGNILANITEADRPHLERLVSPDLQKSRLTLLGDAPGRDTTGRRMKLYKCICGNHIARAPSTVTGSTSNQIRSCGCIKRDRAILLAISQRNAAHAAARVKNRTHGMTGTRFYFVWHSMRSRCNDPAAKGYKNYGGRGITVCERWQRFENFYSDMHAAYLRHIEAHGSDTSLERIDNDDGYSPENCRWATAKEQANNRRPCIWRLMN